MNRFIGPLRAASALLACALVSCGGGGGGSNDDGYSPVVTASGSSFEVVGIAPYPSLSNTLVLTLTGGRPQGYYAMASSDVSGLEGNLIVNSDGSASVSVVDALPPQTGRTLAGTVTVKLCTDGSCDHVVWTHDYPVTYDRFSVDLTPLTLVGHEGADTPVTVAVSPPDTQNVLSFQSSASGIPAPWLTGKHDGAGNLVVTASAASLSSGNYSASLNIGFSGLGQSAASIPVNFNVGAGLTAPALADIVERVDTTPASLQGSATIAFAERAGSWTATSDSPWLVIDTPAGNGATTLSYHVDTSVADATIANWSAGTATVTLKSSGMSDATTVLNYRRQLPEIVTVTPSQVWPGQTATVHVAGRGLSQLSGVGQISVGSQAVAGGSIDSDTGATLQLPAQVAGSLQVGVGNALHVTSTQANLAVAAGRLSYAVLATSGAKNNIVYDPSRLAVFASDDDASTLLQWRLVGANWVETAMPWAGIWRVQLSPDRQTLYVLAKGSLSEVDPDTLAVRVTHDGWTWSGFDFDEALPITNDMRMWLPESGTQYFDLRTHAFAVAPATEFPNVGLTTMAATPDGSYLYSVDGESSPAPPDGWYSAATQTNAPLATGVLERAYRVSFDLDGKLGLFDWESVYRTGTWTLVGTATLPTGQDGAGGVISPDGTRVYRLSGNNVVVFDTTQLQPGTSQFVQVGSFGIANSAVNCSVPECDGVGRLVIDPLGTNLFWVGNQNFVVIPIPAGMAGTASAKSTGRLLPSAAMTARRH